MAGLVLKRVRDFDKVLDNLALMLETGEGVNGSVGTHGNGIDVGRALAVFIKDSAVVGVSVCG
jgi:hypothetical protein